MTVITQATPPSTPLPRSASSARHPLADDDLPHTPFHPSPGSLVSICPSGQHLKLLDLVSSEQQRQTTEKLSSEENGTIRAPVCEGGEWEVNLAPWVPLMNLPRLPAPPRRVLCPFNPLPDSPMRCVGTSIWLFSVLVKCRWLLQQGAPLRFKAP